MGKETAEIKARALTAEDLPWLLPMDAASFPEPWDEKSWQDEINGRLAHYLVLETENGPAAYGGFWLVAGEAQVMRLAVDPRQRGKKLGLALVSAMLDLARRLQASEMTLEVREGNVPARKTYLHLGFSECGRRPHYYSDNGEDAVLMRLAL